MATYLDNNGLSSLWSKINDKFLPKSGGTVTGTITQTGGQVIRKLTNVTTGTNPSSAVYTRAVEWQDSQNKQLGALEHTYATNGTSSMGLMASVLGTDNSTQQRNQIIASVTRDGSKSYTVSDPAKFRTAIGANASGVFPVGVGGTGLTASPSMLTNLASTSAANVFAASPRPGVTGALGIANGGTGSNTARKARIALSLEYGPVSSGYVEASKILGYGHVTNDRKMIQFQYPIPRQVDGQALGAHIVYFRGVNGGYLIGSSSAENQGVYLYSGNVTLYGSTTVIGTYTSEVRYRNLAQFQLNMNAAISGAINNTPISALVTLAEWWPNAL